MMKGLSESSKYEYRVEMVNERNSSHCVVREFASDFEEGECWGYNRFFQIDLLEKEGYLSQDDTITLRFYVRSPTYHQQCRDQKRYIEQLEATIAENALRETELKQRIEALKKQTGTSPKHRRQLSLSDSSLPIYSRSEDNPAPTPSEQDPTPSSEKSPRKPLQYGTFEEEVSPDTFWKDKEQPEETVPITGTLSDGSNSDSTQSSSSAQKEEELFKLNQNAELLRKRKQEELSRSPSPWSSPASRKSLTTSVDWLVDETVVDEPAPSHPSSAVNTATVSSSPSSVDLTWEQLELLEGSDNDNDVIEAPEIAEGNISRQLSSKNPPENWKYRSQSDGAEDSAKDFHEDTLPADEVPLQRDDWKDEFTEDLDSMLPVSNA